MTRVFGSHLLTVGGAVLCSTLALPATAQGLMPSAEEMQCGPMRAVNRVPPMDYRTNRKMLEMVEMGHFTAQVENLVKPMFGNFGSDIDYTLHAYPNHPRALVTLVRLGEREKTEKPKGSAYTIDCYFRRAIRFASSDLVVRMLYAQYLNKNGKRDAAVLQLNYVEASAADNAMTRYNLGLLLFEVEAFDRALAQAHQAMSLGLNPAELKRLLTEKGLWRDPPEPGVAASGAASAVTAK